MPRPLTTLAPLVSAPAPPVPALPQLRDELRLLPAAPNHDGSPAWMVNDPVCNRFYRIGWVDFELLLRWSMGTEAALIASINLETTLTVQAADVAGLVQFLGQHDLLRANDQAGAERLSRRAASSKHGALMWLLHHYLFFRVPLVRPQRWLASLLPAISWLFTAQAAWAVILLSATGLLLAARQWETFSHTFVDQLSWSGAVGFAVALGFAKALHELGHALTATRYGVRVAHMGVAMLVMFPMLYTDTSESWKLSNPRQRLAIASAGIITELGLAGLATLAWSLAPDGPMRSALFFLATTSWILTLAVNASPFMRFDGYFILTDVLDLPNLHERAGALARNWLRRSLLGWIEPWPEHLPGRGNAALIAFALATWLYRLVVFLGIALLVYFYFFKVLGIILMAVELAWFIGRPITSEFKVWFASRKHIKTRRIGWAALLLAGLLAMLVVPWQTGVHGWGWIHPERQQVVFSPLAGRVLALPQSEKVSAGQLLFVLEAPDLRLAASRYTGMAEARERELVGLGGLPDGEERRKQLQLEREKFKSEALVFQNAQARLNIAAAFSGVLFDIDPALAPGVWVQPRQPLGVLVDPSRWVVDTFIAESDIGRIRVGQTARVHLGRHSSVIQNARVIEVDTARSQVLPHPMLDAHTGGPIVTLSAAPGDGQQGTRLPQDALYRVRIQLDSAPALRQMVVSRVVIQGEGRAYLAEVFDRIAAVFVRESGF